MPDASLPCVPGPAKRVSPRRKRKIIKPHSQSGTIEKRNRVTKVHMNKDHVCFGLEQTWKSNMNTN